MPTYEYACPKCGIIECFQSIKDQPLQRCPQCKRGKVTRLFSGGGGVIFKGSGFWETDYNRSSDYRAKQKSESGDPASAAKSQAQQKPAEPKPVEPKTATPGPAAAAKT